MKRLKFETEDQLEMFCLNRLAEVRQFDLSDISNPMCSSIAEIVKDIADVLIVSDFVRVEEFED